MQIIDLHCDALLKLWEDKTRLFTKDSMIEASYSNLKVGKVRLQLFAIFIEPHFSQEMKFQYALEQIDLFHTEVVGKHENIKKIERWEDINYLQEGEIGAILTLEGADAFSNDLVKLRLLYQLGVKSLGLTWNNANLCADGVGEQRGGGLTELGFEVVNMNNEHLVWTDVSHLSYNGFWDVMNTAKYPIASHSNSKTVCDHPRNLTDEQAEALFKRNGFIGLVFNPPFITGGELATIDDLMLHIDHFCALGGVEHIAFGSDFDGISYHVKGLEDASKYQYFIEELLKKYTEQEVRGFAYENVMKRLPIHMK
ncbi:dipeptidase [Evansella cellulosilytica]|uniref:Membrane dipeptidase n=1 Tax=Evansella cellulosilytica (strain ATCC 21833 / DSM 2522 / FERM P-1141 / JCM 9156 / N-4) TaxID=649639 RepID=E6U098_EVAC2|nr:dipeptidase [Evansella cellulosilytica]ADU30214.1 Membrane dipeptidase [Evansella cellulosilytica DSM 2522]